MKRLAALLLALLIPAQLVAATGQPVIDGFLEPAGFVAIADLSAAVGLSSIPDGVKLTLIQAETQNIRWRDDGTSPTSAVGMLLEAGQTLVYNGDPTAIELIEATASASANISYYR